MRILYLEPYWGGSHRNVAESLARHLKGHFVQFCHLPARFWKCRMRAASFDFLKQIESLAAKEGQTLQSYLKNFDLIFASALFDIAQFKGLLPVCPPLLAYFHENQLCYPQAEHARPLDSHFGLNNISSALAADVVAFNSEFQRREFLAAIPSFLEALPDTRPTWAVERIQKKSLVLHLGIEQDFLAAGAQRADEQNRPPIILWNHRWEFDKQPEHFFAALRAVKKHSQGHGVFFRLVVLGENSQAQSKVFEQAKEEFAAEILHWGFSQNAYLDWLSRCDLVVSCAIQENFGIAILEAVAAGAWPLLPKRLSYPELFAELPKEILGQIFYHNSSGLISLLCQHLNPLSRDTYKKQLLQHVAHFTWQRRIPDFKNCLQSIARTRQIH